MQKQKRRPGRPPVDPAIKKIPVAHRLPYWLVDWLRQQDATQSELIEQALIGQYKLIKPK